MTNSSQTDRSARSFRSNLNALKSAQKPAFGTPAYSRLVNRPAGRRVAAAAELWGMTPNTATAISATMSGLAIALLATLQPTWWSGLTVAALLAGGYVMDSVDGQLARLDGSGSVRGEWLDHTVDCFKTGTLHLAVLISWYRFPPAKAESILLIPLGFQVVQVVTFFCLILMPFLRASKPAAVSPAASSQGREHPLRKWLILPTDYGFMCWVFVLMAASTTFFVLYTALFAASAALLAAALVKWWRELGALDAQTAP